MSPPKLPNLNDRRSLTDQNLRRPRKRRTPEEQGVFDATGKPERFHDILVVAPSGVHGTDELFRVPVVKLPNKAEVPGAYVDMPEKLDLYDYAQRKTLAVARPQDWGTERAASETRGPAFATLPVKREPAATNCVTCYLVDAQNFTHRNAWTAEEWNDIGAEDLEPAPSADDDTLEVLVAGPRGKVFYLKLPLGDADGTTDFWRPGDNATLPNGGYIEALNLRHETEVWTQLRNGSVAGRVLSVRKAELDKQPLDSIDTIPLVNITSLTPE